jgi:hypothetical protein
LARTGEEMMKPMVGVLQRSCPAASSAWTERSSEPQNVVPSSARAAAVQGELPNWWIHLRVPSWLMA